MWKTLNGKKTIAAAALWLITVITAIIVKQPIPTEIVTPDTAQGWLVYGLTAASGLLTAVGLSHKAVKKDAEDNKPEQNNGDTA